MGAKDYIESHFGITVIKITPTVKGSGSTFDVITDTGRFIAKYGVRPDYISIQRKAHPVLEQAGLKQARIIFHDEQFTLYEWLDGDGNGTLTPERMHNSVLYISRYLEALKSVSVNETEIMRINAWDDAKSLDFLLDEFPNYAEYITDPCLSAAVGHLYEHRQLIDRQPKQLVHGDLGADNFLFVGNDVGAIIDFTPEIVSDLYGLCQFLYWNVLWQENNPSSLHKWADLYSSDIDYEVLDLFMIQAALFRVVGPLLNGYINLDKRIMLLESLLKK